MFKNENVQYVRKKQNCVLTIVIRVKLLDDFYVISVIYEYDILKII